MRVGIILFTTLPSAGDALGATQELQQGNPVLAAEVHELDVLDAVVEEYTFTFRVDAALSSVEVFEQGGGDFSRQYRDLVELDGAPSQLQERGRLQRHVPHEADH